MLGEPAKASKKRRKKPPLPKSGESPNNSTPAAGPLPSTQQTTAASSSHDRPAQPATRGRRGGASARPSKPSSFQLKPDAQDFIPGGFAPPVEQPAPVIAASPKAASSQSPAAAKVVGSQSAPKATSSQSPAAAPKAVSSKSPAVQKMIEQKRLARQQQQEQQQEQQADSSAAGDGGQERKKKNCQKVAFKMSQGHTEMTAHIIDQISNNTYECMICYLVVGKRTPIWSCQRCFTMFHFACIQQWFDKSCPTTAASSHAAVPLTSGFAASSSSSSSSSSSLSSSVITWTCPGCRTQSQGPPHTSCYCRKDDKPAYNHYLLPHSCGDVCGRPLSDAYPDMSPDCPHRCVLQCHPGVCPPCSAIGAPQSCHCGRTSYVLRCCEGRVPRSCQAVCDRLLNCGVHRCTRECHDGACSPCAQPASQRCYCGAVTNSAAVCGSNVFDAGSGGHFSCANACNAPLSCGHHRCAAPCHPGPCQPCATSVSLVRTCPCGRSPIADGARTQCTDPVPLCGGTCDKLLNCGVHRCEAACHHGDCAPCQRPVQIACNCGRTSQPGVCGANAEPFVCTTRCTVKLECGRHQCGEACCSRTPGEHICLRICDRGLKCRGRHTCPELCHRGACPPCSYASYDERVCPCGRTVELPPIHCNQVPARCPYPCSRQHNCDHPPQHNCSRSQSACPPCVELVAVWCMGGHTQRQVLCHQRATTTCGRICGLPLQCGVHGCTRTCHAPPCEDSSALRQAGCNNPCGKELQNCSHQCSARCHPGAPCPTVVCSAPVMLQCKCGRIKQQSVCQKKSGADVPLDQSVRVLPCDDLCQRAERNRNLATAFGIVPTPLGSPFSGLSVPVKFAEKTLDLASTCPRFTESLEKIFVDMIAKGTATHRLPPMNSIQRRLVYEIAAFYRLEAQAVGVEPGRYVTVKRTPSSAVPMTLLSSFLRTSMPSSLGRAASPFNVLIYDLLPSVRSEKIAAILVNFRDQYSLRWLDGSSALLIFPSETMMRGALYILEAARIHARLCKDEVIAGGKIVPVARAPDPSPEPASASSSYVAPTAPWAAGTVKSVPNRISTWEHAERDAVAAASSHDGEQPESPTPLQSPMPPEDWEQLVADEPTPSENNE